MPLLAALLLAVASQAIDAQAIDAQAIDAQAIDAQAADARAEAPRFPDRWLVLDAVDARGRRPFRPDAVFARHLLDRDAPAPAEGEELVGELGEPRRWRSATAADGAVEGPGVAWAYTEIVSVEERVVLARLQGASTLFVDGDAFVGDVYRYGFGGVPVALRAGRTPVFVTGVRGGFELTLEEPPARLFVADWDATLPDWVDTGPAGPAGVLVVNASTRPAPGVRARLELEGGGALREPSAPPIDLVPLGLARLPVELRGGPPTGERLAGWANVRSAEGDEGPPVELVLDVRSGDERHRRTYASGVDGSVQRFALVPPAGGDEEGEAAEDAPFEGNGVIDGDWPFGGGGDDRPGLVLTLHGAGVSAWGQARCYAPKEDLWIAAPTNRRPFGFDWQDWGRRDAYEVLEKALAFADADPDRVHLTGHSMGGHGVWHLAANDPDRFASVAPSAGWASFDTYGGRPDGELTPLWHAADGASLTLGLVDNLAQLPTYVLHGAEDANVPVSEAETMLAALREAGAAPEHHFEEGAGHWWGNRCVDWPPLFELFRRHARPSDPRTLAFTSVDPAVDAEHHWVRVEQPLRYGEPLRVRAEHEEASGRLVVETENVRALVLAPPDERAVTALLVDGQELDWPAGEGRGEGRAAEVPMGPMGPEPRGGSPHAFLREDGVWRVGAPTPGEKRPDRSGPFKRVFDRRVVLVVGTAGEAEETAELLARARHDAAVFGYRGNGLLPVVRDRDFDAAAYRGRNVVLYGNRDSNAAWRALVPAGFPVDVRSGALVLGERRWEGDGLGALFVGPRADDPDALVGAFGSTGEAGARLGAVLAPFVSGVGYPDYALFGPEVLSAGDGGVLAAGWFDERWRLPAGEQEDPEVR